MDHTAIRGTDFQFEDQHKTYKGKVRDVYWVDQQLVMVATDRISAFDHILPKAIPHKGQVLNQVAGYFLNATRDVAPNWLEAQPDPNVSIGKVCQPFLVEMVVRGYLAGHAWREYSAGKRTLCGVRMPEGLRQSDPFAEAIITPTTKAAEGHDADISRDAIIQQGLVDEVYYETMEAYAKALFKRGSAMALDRGLILVDTKYEFGLYEGQVYLMDEVHTPDSSRYFFADGYEERQRNGEAQKQLSKEFVREWLMAHGFQGKEGQLMPEMPHPFVEEVSRRYIQLYEYITGQDFIPANTVEVDNRIRRNVEAYFQGQ